MTDTGCMSVCHVTTVSRMTDSFLTTGEVASILGLARQTVWQRVQSGALVPAAKLKGNRGFLFEKQDIEALKEASK